MAAEAILSVDTANDEASAWFARGRGPVYDELNETHTIVRLTGASATRETMLEALAHGDPFYWALLVSSHGRPGAVLDEDAPDGILFSAADDDETLRTLAANRAVYLCCCESAKGSLPNRLRAAGARLVIGYRGSPAWSCDEGRRVWREFDLKLVRSIVRRQGAPGLRTVRKHYLEEVRSWMPYADGALATDLANMAEVLRSMVIRGGTEE
ncbi:MAG: hypothetical protein ACYTEZ_07110 [Planctomycetota bacterium]